MNNAKKSAFEQFHRELPDIENIETAVAVAAQWLEEKGLIHTLSVLRDEVDPEVLEADVEKSLKYTHYSHASLENIWNPIGDSKTSERSPTLRFHTFCNSDGSSSFFSQPRTPFETESFVSDSLLAISPNDAGLLAKAARICLILVRASSLVLSIFVSPRPYGFVEFLCLIKIMPKRLGLEFFEE